MIKVVDVIQFLERIAPPKFQESYDNAGLIVGESDTEVTGILVSLDATVEVVEEAKSLGCNLVIAHHPIIFKGLKKISQEHYIGRSIIRAVKDDIALYAIHTNLDNVFLEGVNQRIGQQLGLQNMEILFPKKGIEYRNSPVGSGLIGELTEAMDATDFLHFLKKSMLVSTVKHTRLLGNPIKRVAVCGGAGSFLVGQAVRRQADIFVSADFKYHEFFEANDQIIIADIGHYESEQFTINLLTNILSDKFNIFAVHSTKVDTNPVLYI